MFYTQTSQAIWKARKPEEAFYNPHVIKTLTPQEANKQLREGIINNMSFPFEYNPLFMTSVEILQWIDKLDQLREYYIKHLNKVVEMTHDDSIDTDIRVPQYSELAGAILELSQWIEVSVDEDTEEKK